MNSFSKFSILERLKLVTGVALLLGFANFVLGQGVQCYLTANNYNATTGGSISGTAGIAQNNNCPPPTYEVWSSYTSGTPEAGCIDLYGTNPHPITSSDVNYPINIDCGDPSYITFTYPNNTQSFSIACTNTALNYDKTGTISIDSECTPTTINYSSASVTIYNTASSMQIAFLLGTNLYNSLEMTRFEGVQTGAVEILRGFGDTYNNRTVYYSISGSAVSNVDYTGPITGVTNIAAGTNLVNVLTTSS